jgi:hypothetical protein
LRGLGLAPELLEQARDAIAQRNRQAVFRVWPEHWHALIVLQAMQTQWRAVAGMSRVLWTGMDYAALPVVVKAISQAVPRRHRQKPAVLLRQLRIMEAAEMNIRNGA